MSISNPVFDNTRCSLLFAEDPTPPAEPARPKRPVSQRKIEANRANAKKSTGPRTAEGKARSSRNALKHGLCAESALLPGECPAAYEMFTMELEEELQPRTIMQRTLFPQIATLAWRLRRLPDTERELFRIEQQRHQRGTGDPPVSRAQGRDGGATELPPCVILARAFADENEASFIRFNRYDRSMQNAFLRLLGRYYYLKKHHPTMPTDPDEPPVPRERAWAGPPVDRYAHCETDPVEPKLRDPDPTPPANSDSQCTSPRPQPPGSDGVVAPWRSSPSSSLRDEPTPPHETGPRTPPGDAASPPAAAPAQEEYCETKPAPAGDASSALTTAQPPRPGREAADHPEIRQMMAAPGPALPIMQPPGRSAT